MPKLPIQRNNGNEKTPVIVLVIGLIQDDDDFHSEVINFVQHTSRSGVNFIYCKNLEEVERLSTKNEIHVVLLDMSLQSGNGSCIITQVHSQLPEKPIIVLTSIDENLMNLDLQNKGVQDYLAIEHLDSNFLMHSIYYAIERQKMQNFLEEKDISLAQRHFQLSQLLSHTIDGVLIVDLKGTIQFVNPAGEHLLGEQNSDLLNSTFDYPLHNHQNFEIEIVRDNGDTSVIESRVVDTSWENKPAYLITLRDITELKKIQAQNEQTRIREKHLAYHDLLTGLPNRQLVNDRMSQALVQSLRENKQFALLFLDLDGFKNVNDSLGHAQGDLLLKNVAKRLKKCVRISDTVGRYGGDEFVILMNDISRDEDAARVAQKIIVSINEPFAIKKQHVQITTSIGIAIFPTDGNTTSDLLQNADTAMYHAKNNGKGTAKFYNQDIQISSTATFDLDYNLRKAFKNNEYLIHFQPQIESQNNNIIGIEALLRWNHPKFGIIDPKKYLPKTEYGGFNEKLGLWFLDQSCRQYKGWKSRHDYQLKLALNLSPYQIRQKNLEKTLDMLLDKYQISAHSLNLEICGCEVNLKSTQVMEQLNNLTQYGISLTYVGFGKQDCSFPHLIEFPFDFFKIDENTTALIKQKNSFRKALQGIIQIAHQFDKSVIACGVETEKDIEILKNMGCDLLQGHGICKPVPEAGLINFIDSKEAQLIKKIQTTGYKNEIHTVDHQKIVPASTGQRLSRGQLASPLDSNILH
ncbi:MAG: diguanylate cyclase [Calditrichaeota bacterium]|nr:MAG: diguanylate cyclase [Calditrichota bacterium]